MEEIKAIHLEGNQRMVTKERNALFRTVGLLFFWEMVALLRAYAGFITYVLFFAIEVSCFFVGLGLYTKKKPYTAVVLVAVINTWGWCNWLFASSFWRYNY